MDPNSAQNIRLFNGIGWSIRGIKSGKLKKLQITHRIDDGLQHENPQESILTSIEFVQQNSPDIQTLIKDLHGLIYNSILYMYKKNANYFPISPLDIKYILLIK